MESEEDPATTSAAALASSRASLGSTFGASSTAGFLGLGLGSSLGLGGSSSAEARLGALVGKLGHPLREVRT